MSIWNKKRPIASAWRKRAVEDGIDKDIALLIARYLPANISVQARALCHVNLLDLLSDAARSVRRSAKET